MKVRVEPLRGHISLHRGHEALATFTDLGPVLSLWLVEGVELDPSAAGELGAALTAWSERKGGRS